MVGLNVVFWILVLLFALIGMTRGWAKELLVTFAVILGIFIIAVLVQFMPYFQIPQGQTMNSTQFWLRVGILLALVFFGYQSPHIPRLAGSGRFARDYLQDSLLGFVLGAVNGYLIWGTIWFFLHSANYPFPQVYTLPPVGSPTEQAIAQLIRVLPPNWLEAPFIYFAVAIAFAFVLVVFI
ncbi:MAG TPA: CvpA family protein [Levilinea sp.]|nr:CvpA family protein [Levilinea sp.]